MSFVLRVTAPFGAFKIGDLINDAECIGEIIGSETERYCVRVFDEAERLIEDATDHEAAS